MAESDTIKSSAITDHPFMAGYGRPYLCGWIYTNGKEPVMCKMAEAAHRETTVKR